MPSSQPPTTSAATGLMDLLLRSGEALRNWRALLTLVLTGVVTLIILMAAAASGNAFVTFLGALLNFMIFSVGVSATGILLMDQALDQAPRGIGSAIADGIFAAIRLFVIMLIGAAVALLVILAVAVLVLVCKIPVLGSLLYAVVLPGSVLAVAFIYAGLYFVFALAGASVWSGAPLRQAVTTLYAIITRRLVESALGVVVHSLLMLMVAGLIMVFVLAGVGVVVGLSAGILGSSIGMPNLSMLSGGSGAGGIVYAGLFGFGILFALIGAVLFSMTILGLNRLYLHLTANLDLAGASAALNGHLDAARERARAMQEEARRRAEEIRQRTPQAAPQNDDQTVVSPMPPTAARPAPIPAAMPAPICPKCAHGIAFDDAFCGNCGQRLK